MDFIELIKKANTVLIFALLVTTLTSGVYLIKRLRRPIDTVHVTVDSLRLHKK